KKPEPTPNIGGCSVGSLQLSDGVAVRLHATVPVIYSLSVAPIYAGHLLDPQPNMLVKPASLGNSATELKVSDSVHNFAVTSPSSANEGIL
ncbi:MAG: hypothetical protein WA673_06550, partial [Candidatus Acidiferrales bacterium]